VRAGALYLALPESAQGALWGAGTPRLRLPREIAGEVRDLIMIKDLYTGWAMFGTTAFYFQ